MKFGSSIGTSRSLVLHNITGHLAVRFVSLCAKMLYGLKCISGLPVDVLSTNGSSNRLLKGLSSSGRKGWTAPLGQPYPTGNYFDRDCSIVLVALLRFEAAP